LSTNSETQTPAPTRWRTWAVPECVTVLGAALTAAAYGGRWGWLWELTTHFRVQYFWALTIAAMVLAVCRRPLWTTAAGVFAAMNLAVIAPLYFAPDVPTERGTPMRALSLNVYWHNNQFAKVLHWIRQEQPDFFLLLEVTPQWIGACEELEDDYPYHRAAAQLSPGGIAFYSRVPTASLDIRYVGGMPTVVAHMAPATGPFTVIGAHPSSPRSAAEFARRNREIDALTELAVFQRGPRVLIGDLNTTSWSPYFQDFLEATGLVDSRLGFGVEPTWPALPLPLRIPIDHCLVSRDVAVTGRRVGPAVGSDHRGVAIDLSIMGPPRD
jgi:endonuclease/exonuclease/phosphatase (EEP) superfamily protein YafD